MQLLQILGAKKKATQERAFIPMNIYPLGNHASMKFELKCDEV